MRLPKGKLLALVALVLAASMVMATGAFSTVTAERSVDVQVTGDKSAFLAMQPSEGENSDYASTNGNDEIAIDLSSDAGGDVTGEGVNPDAVTSFDNVFTLTNQGSQSVDVWIEDGSDQVDFYAGESKDRLDSQGESVSIDPGETKHVGIVVNALDEGPGSIISGEDNVIVHANAPNAEAPEEAPDGPGSGGSDS